MLKYNCTSTILDPCGKLWDGGCPESSEVIVANHNGGSRDKVACRRLCEETENCAVFVIKKQGTGTCELYIEDSIEKCTRGVDLKYDTYSVNICRK